MSDTPSKKRKVTHRTKREVLYDGFAVIKPRSGYVPIYKALSNAAGAAYRLGGKVERVSVVRRIEAPTKKTRRRRR